MRLIKSVSVFLFLLFFRLANAQQVQDSIFHNSDFVICGEIINISNGIIDDLGTEYFMVTIDIETVYKQNSHLNIPNQSILWEVSNLICKEPELKYCVEQYRGQKWIFLLNTKHVNGTGDRLDNGHIIPFNAVNHKKVIDLAESEKIVINPYFKLDTCKESCRFCRNIHNEKWKLVKSKIKSETRKSNRNKHKKSSEHWLSTHKNVKYILPMGIVLASLPSYGTNICGFLTKGGEKIKTLGFQLGYIYRFFCFFSIENVNYHGLKNFSDGELYFENLMNALRIGIINECYDSNDTNGKIPTWIPSNEYIKLWYAFENENAYFVNGKLVQKYSPEYISNLKHMGYVYSLCLLNLHSNLHVRIQSINSLRELNDKRCIPYLIELAQFYSDKYITDTNSAPSYQNYLKEIIFTLDQLTGCRTAYPFGTDLQQFRLGLGLPIWKSKVIIN